MAKRPESNSQRLPPLDSWRSLLRPERLADRLHSAVVAAMKIAADAGYKILPPSDSQTHFEIAQNPSEDWALPRPVQEAVQLLELANELVPMLAAAAPDAKALLIERAFTAGELSARMPAWAGVTIRRPKT